MQILGEEILRLNAREKIVANSRYFYRQCIRCSARDNHLCEKLVIIGEATNESFARQVTVTPSFLVSCRPQTLLEFFTPAEPLAITTDEFDQFFNSTNGVSFHTVDKTGKRT